MVKRLTRAELDAVCEAIGFRLAGDLDDATEAETERHRDALESALDKLNARRPARSEAARG